MYLGGICDGLKKLVDHCVKKRIKFARDLKHVDDSSP